MCRHLVAHWQLEFSSFLHFLFPFFYLCEQTSFCFQHSHTNTHIPTRRKKIDVALHRYIRQLVFTLSREHTITAQTLFFFSTKPAKLSKSKLARVSLLFFLLLFLASSLCCELPITVAKKSLFDRGRKQQNSSCRLVFSFPAVACSFFFPPFCITFFFFSFFLARQFVRAGAAVGNH